MLNVISNSLNQGFQMTFENGLTISVQFGKMNYCSNRKQEKGVLNECKDAEIAIWDENGKDYNFKSEGIAKGYVYSNEIAKIIYQISIAKNIDSIEL